MAPPRVVLDTNVVISAHLNPHGLERLVLRLALRERLGLYLSKDIFAEYEGVLYREKFGISPEMLAESLALIRKAATFVEPKRKLTISSDAEDNRFLECAEAADADYLVTGNKRHFPKNWEKTKVVNARELIAAIALEFRR